MLQSTHDLIHRLSPCIFVPASAEKRFVRQLACMKIDESLTEKQLIYLGQVAYRFRKQMSQQTQGPLQPTVEAGCKSG